MTFPAAREVRAMMWVPARSGNRSGERIDGCLSGILMTWHIQSRS